MKINAVVKTVQYDIGTEHVTLVVDSLLGLRSVYTTQGELQALVAPDAQWGDEQCRQVAEQRMQELFADMLEPSDALTTTLNGAVVKDESPAVPTDTADAPPAQESAA